MPRQKKTTPASATDRLQNILRADKNLLHQMLDTAPPPERLSDPRYRPTSAGKLYDIFSTWSGEGAPTD